jgi:predicted hydrocarbon binding protein
VVAGLEEVDEETARKVLKKCGEACAKSWLDAYGYDPASYDLDSWIKLLNESDLGVRNVKRENNCVIYELKHGRCVCPLVSENTVELAPKLCLACSTNFFEHIFGKAAKRPVRVEAIESFATGADKCAFRVWLR